MKGFLIGPDNERFEAEIVRYFKNVNDYYLIYTKNEKDANGYVLLYVTKVISDSGIKVGETVTDENEWALIKSFLQKTVSENKEGRALTIEDCNPAEIADLKINSQRPFKLSEASVELFGRNKKSFEIVQKMAAEQNIVKVPVAPEVTEFVTDNNEEPKVENVFNFESPVNQDVTPVTDDTPVEVNNESVELNNSVEENVVESANKKETPIENPTVEVAPTNSENINTVEVKEETNNFEQLYKEELEKNASLTKEIEQLKKDNQEYIDKLNKLRELLG